MRLFPPQTLSSVDTFGFCVGGVTATSAGDEVSLQDTFGLFSLINNNNNTGYFNSHTCNIYVKIMSYYH